jgi:hypothetical protein
MRNSPKYDFLGQAKQIIITEIQRFKNGFRIKCGMTDVGLIQFGGQDLHFVQDDNTNSGNHIGLPLRGDDRFTACAKKELFTPGIKPGAFGYNVNVVEFF